MRLRTTRRAQQQRRAHAARGAHASFAGPQTANAVAWMEEMMDYNVPLGKLNRGLAVLDGEAPAAAAACVNDPSPALPLRRRV